MLAKKRERHYGRLALFYSAASAKRNVVETISANDDTAAKLVLRVLRRAKQHFLSLIVHEWLAG